MDPCWLPDSIKVGLSQLIYNMMSQNVLAPLAQIVSRTVGNSLNINSAVVKLENTTETSMNGRENSLAIHKKLKILLQRSRRWHTKHSNTSD